MGKKLICGYRVFLLVVLVNLTAVSCRQTPQQTSHENVVLDIPSHQEREEVNGMQGEIIASDGKVIYMLGNAEGMIYQIDLSNNELKVNCGDLLCTHEGLDCSAKLPISEYSIYALRRNGDKVYVLGEQIYEIGENYKKKIGSGYGNYGNQIVFGKYIAYFAENDKIVVKELETKKEIQVFEGITGYAQGNFYYDGYLYYVTAENQLVRLQISSGKCEVLEKKGATRASVYEGNIYYVKVSENTETNYLVRLNPNTLEKTDVIEGVFYYNMYEDKIYYSTYPKREYFFADLDGSNQIRLTKEGEIDAGFLWTFHQSDTVILCGADCYTYYTLDKNRNVNWEEPISRPQ